MFKARRGCLWSLRRGPQRMPAEHRSRAALIEFPDRALRHALAVLRDDGATELETALAESVIVVALQRGSALPRWVTRMLRALVKDLEAARERP